MGALTALCVQDLNRSTNRGYCMKESPKKQPIELLCDQAIIQILSTMPKIKKKMQYNDYQIDGKIGEGGFANVLLCQLKQNIKKGIIQKYALKKISKQVLMTKRVYENAKLQKSILAELNSPFIVSLIYAFQDRLCIYFVMEFAEGGDTYELINKKSVRLEQFQALGQTAVRFIAGCVILGLEYLHAHGIMYRDLKPENVLIFSNGYVKITDFGLAKKSLDDEESKSVSGTPIYYAPEMILKTGYKKEIDLWTLGIYIYQLSVLEPPFTNDQLQKNKIQEACQEAKLGRDWKGAHLSQQLKSLINGLLEFDPDERLGAGQKWNQIKQHKFFKDFDWIALTELRMQSPIQKIAQKYPMFLLPYREQEVITYTIEEPENLQGFTHTREDQI